MSDQKKETQLVKPEMLQKFNNIQDQITSIELFEKNGAVNMMAVAAAKANVIAQLHLLLDENLVGNIKKTLENTNLGFKTDKAQGGYPLATIRTALVESAIKGFYWHNNEFNIIAGNCYFTKEGLKGFMDRSPRFSDVRLSFGVPKVEKENQRAIIEVKATWKYDGVEDRIDATIPIKWNSYTTDDAIIGKANRKLRARIIEQATGNVIPEAEAEEYLNEVKNNFEDTTYEVEETDDLDEVFGEEAEQEIDQSINEAEQANDMEVESAEDVAEDTNTLSEKAKEEPTEVKGEVSPSMSLDWSSPANVVSFISRTKNTKELSLFKRENKEIIKALKGANRDMILKALDDKENFFLKNAN